MDAAIDSVRLREVVAEHVDAGLVPGAVVAVSRGGRVWLDAVGRAAVDGPPMATDAVVRISSMTKPLTAVLTLLLAQDGVLDLHDPVERWLPELVGRRVLRRLDGPVTATEPAEHRTTVEDLLTMRMGFGFAFEVESCPVADLAAAAGLGMGPPLPSAVPHSPDEWLARFAELPLMEQPGRHWRYELAFAVLGVVLARAAGAPLAQVLAERLLLPLGMADTGFAVPEHARSRLVPCYTADGAGGLALLDGVDDSDWLAAPSFPHAGGGLVSTAPDYLRFARFVLAGGVHEGARLLSGGAVAAMTTDQLTPAQRSGSSAGAFLDGGGWGYGVQVLSTGTGPSSRTSRFGWGGGLGTTWFAHPGHDTTAVLLTQCLPPPGPLVTAFWAALQEGLDD